jgi:hypothetical protein
MFKLYEKKNSMYFPFEIAVDKIMKSTTEAAEFGFGGRKHETYLSNSYNQLRQ